MEMLLIWPIGIVVLFILFGLRVINQYDRGVVLTLGKYTSTRQPGLTWLLIGFQRMIKIDMRITTTDIPQQEVITKDNVPVGINAVVYFQVQSAENAILNIKDYMRGKNVARVKGRIVGESGRALQTLSQLSDCYFEIKGNQVGIIGDPENIENAQNAIIMLIKGSKLSIRSSFFLLWFIPSNGM